MSIRRLAVLATAALFACSPDQPEPETELLSGPEGAQRGSQARFEFTSPTAGATFECRLNGAVETCVSPRVYTGLADGSYTFEVLARAANKADPTPATRTFSLDNAGPETTIEAGPPLTTESSTAAFTFSSSETGASFECSFDGAAFAACQSPLTFSAIALGDHAFEVRAVDALGNADPTPASHTWTSTSGGTTTTVTVLAANTTGGSGKQAYEERDGPYDGPGIRMFMGLQPDIVAIQEWNFRANAIPQDFDAFALNVFGAGYVWYREPETTGISNGIISRYPFCSDRSPNAGEWDDVTMTDRDFVWACIDIPGAKHLWVVSVHFKASSGTANEDTRLQQADQIVSHLASNNVPTTDYLVVAGDFNTHDRSTTDGDGLEKFLVGGTHATLGPLVGMNQVTVVDGPYPADHLGEGDTNSNRNKPLDMVLVDSELTALEVPFNRGGVSYTDGLVFDSRVHGQAQLDASFAPVKAGDSCPCYSATDSTVCAMVSGSCPAGATVTGMQHMNVIRAFALPN